MWVICHQCQFPFIKRGPAHKLLIITEEINLSRFPWGKLLGWCWNLYDAVIVRRVSNVKPTYNDRKTKILNSWLSPPKSEGTDMEKKKKSSKCWVIFHDLPGLSLILSSAPSGVPAGAAAAALELRQWAEVQLSNLLAVPCAVTTLSR